MISAKQVAEWFINRAKMDKEMYKEESISFTNLKLQKMLYYAQSMSLAVYGKKLFDDKLIAWKYGPVVPNVYQTYKVCGKNDIEVADAVTFEDDIVVLLEYVYEQFGKFTAIELMKKTHNEKPYKTIYKEGEDNEMPDKLLKENFKKEYLKDVDIDTPERRKQYLQYAETSYINSLPQMKNIDDTSEKVEVDWAEWDM